MTGVPKRFNCTIRNSFYKRNHTWKQSEPAELIGRGGEGQLIGKSEEELWDEYVEEYAKEYEQMEKEQREMAEAVDAYMKEHIEELRSDEELVELLEGLEEGMMVHIIVE